MSRLQENQTDDYSDEIISLHSKLQELFDSDFLPNFFKPLSKDKDVLTGITHMYDQILYKGDLPGNLKELIFLTIALKHKYHYCSSLHYTNLRKIDEKEVHHVLNDITKIENDLIRGILLFSIRVIDSPQEIKTEEYLELEKLGLSKNEILEVISTASFSSSNIKTAIALGVKSEEEISNYINGETIKFEF